ncbi:hypothetical protein FACS1894142_3710 [Spirochaetia bacterium]|nr:hypothetical protein FACS1894142_3710 [Spirochaetia bacterium]
MAGRKIGDIVTFGLAFLILVGGALGLWSFSKRPPVLVVTDEVFDGLYGVERARLKQAQIAFKLLRPVKTVRIAENSGADVVSFAVEDASAHPWCVLFPYCYYQGAGRYARQFPETPVFLIGGQFRDSGEGRAIVTDTLLDRYRAGLGAALLAADGGDVLFFYTDPASGDERDAFEAGLRAGGYERTPRYLRGSADYSTQEGVSCAVIAGQADSFLEETTDIPVILCSWIDPALTPRRVKLVFDDSPWAFAVRAAELAPLAEGGVPLRLPSEATVLDGRIPDKELRQKLKAAVLTTPQTAFVAENILENQ